MEAVTAPAENVILEIKPAARLAFAKTLAPRAVAVIAAVLKVVAPMAFVVNLKPSPKVPAAV